MESNSLFLHYEANMSYVYVAVKHYFIISVSKFEQPNYLLGWAHLGTNLYLDKCPSS